MQPITNMGFGFTMDHRLWTIDYGPWTKKRAPNQKNTTYATQAIFKSIV